MGNKHSRANIRLGFRNSMRRLSNRFGGRKKRPGKDESDFGATPAGSVPAPSAISQAKAARYEVIDGIDAENAGTKGTTVAQVQIQVQPPAKLDFSMPTTHFKCRNAQYGRSTVQRFAVPDDKVNWNVEFSDYMPVYHLDSIVRGKGGNRPEWADPEEIYDDQLPVGENRPKWNELDGRIDRRSHMGVYSIDQKHGVPLNPIGRTGMIGRGLLGRWGPNHAADPIVTRWKRDEKNEVVLHEADSKPVLEFVAIKRTDTGEWAIPGGMVDAGEQISMTLKREFAEEAMNVLEADSDNQREQIDKMISNAFNSSTEVYRGYVDDPRNTDNSWMETIAVNAHDETGNNVGKFKLHAGDDAVGVQWTTIGSELKLYASHVEFVRRTALLQNAHW